LDAQDDSAFAAELNGLLANFAGRPTPLTRCRNLPDNIYLKREDLLHGGAHKTNQVLAQALLARRMGKSRLIAETGAGRHGGGTASIPNHGSRVPARDRAGSASADVRSARSIARCRSRVRRRRLECDRPVRGFPRGRRAADRSRGCWPRARWGRTWRDFAA